jgi:hypothetical protein
MTPQEPSAKQFYVRLSYSELRAGASRLPKLFFRTAGAGLHLAYPILVLHFLA